MLEEESLQAAVPEPEVVFLEPTVLVPETPSKFSRAEAAGRLRSGVVQMILSQVVSSITPLLLVTLYLRTWGATTYGRWLALTSLISYLSLLDLGGQTFIGNLAAIDFAKGDMAAMREKLSEGLSIFSAIALGALAVLSAVLLLIPGVTAHATHFQLLPADRFILFLMAGTYLLAMPGSIFAVSYRSSGLIGRGTAIGTYSRLVAYILYAVALWLGVGPVGYAGVNMAAGIMGTTVLLIDAPMHIEACRGLRVHFSLARRGLKMLSGSLFFWVLSVANAVNQQGVVLVLAGLSGADAVVTFVTHRMVANALLYITSIFQGPISPEMTFLYARGNIEGLARLLKMALKTVVIMSALAAMVLWFAAPFAYRVWTRHKVIFDPMLLAILLAQVVLSAAWNTSGWSLIAVNRHRGLAYANFANAALTVVFALLLVPHFGVYGAAGGSLLGDVLCGLFVYPALAARLSGCSVLELYGAAAAPLTLVCGVQTVLMFLQRHMAAPAFYGVALLGLAVTTLLTYKLVFDAGERHWIVGELQRIARIGPKPIEIVRS